VLNAAVEFDDVNLAADLPLDGRRARRIERNCDRAAAGLADSIIETGALAPNAGITRSADLMPTCIAAGTIWTSCKGRWWTNVHALEQERRKAARGWVERQKQRIAELEQKFAEMQKRFEENVARVWMR